MNTRQKIAESNRIEGIDRPPTQAEIDEHERFVYLEKVDTSELVRFVKIYQPNAVLRAEPHLNVRIGSHIPPRGGQQIVDQLQLLLTAANEETIDPWEAHVRYESLHPFTDGNGRSGRALWYFMMSGSSRADLGFLHAFYYQTLKKCAVNFEST